MQNNNKGLQNYNREAKVPQKDEMTAKRSKITTETQNDRKDM